ncbi:hypothetical protein [Pseudomonas sp. F1_0610]|uniref:hypothetical protein n=1 Tax=Pseudomonas sp. F1_0610 TaxID=3114284 RepID=UPI0039C30E7C
MKVFYWLIAFVSSACTLPAQANSLVLANHTCSETYDSMNSKFSQQGELAVLKIGRVFPLEAKKISQKTWPQDTASTEFVLVEGIVRETQRKQPFMFRVIGNELHLTINEINGEKRILRVSLGNLSNTSEALLETVVIDSHKHILSLAQQKLHCRMNIGH